MFRKIFFLSIVFILCFFVCANAARLVWDANTETDLAGYKVYRGQSSRVYDNTVDVGNVTEHQIEGLSPGTYYFAVSAYNTSEAESGFSNEVVYVEGQQAIAAATDVKVAYKEASAMALEYKGITTVISTIGDVNQNIEIPSGSTLALICISGYLDTRESMAASVSIDSQSASLAVYEAGSGDEEMSEIWYVRGFATGTKNLTIDLKDAVYGYHIYVVFFSGENPTTPIASPLTDLGSNVSIELTTVSGDIGLILLTDYDNDGTLNQNGQTVIADLKSGEYSDYPDIAYKAATGATLTLTGTNSSGGSACAVTIKAAAIGGYTLDAVGGSYALTGQATTLKAGRKLVPDAGSYALTGQAMTPKYGRKVIPEAGSYAITGQASDLKYGRKVSVEGGSCLLSGQACGLLKTSKLPIDAGSYTLTGIAAGVFLGRKIPIGEGSYALIGQDLGLLWAKKIAVEAGAYIVTGMNVTLTCSGAGPKYIYPDPGAYAITGGSVNLLLGRKIDIGTGDYVLTGAAANFRKGRTLSIEPGSYLLTGQGLSLLKTHKLAIEPGTYVLTGQDVLTLFGRKISIESGSYGVTGQDLSFLLARKIIIGAGAYALAGFDVTLLYSAEDSIRQKIMSAIVLRFTALELTEAQNSIRQKIMEAMKMRFDIL